MDITENEWHQERTDRLLPPSKHEPIRRAFAAGHAAQGNAVDGAKIENPHISTSNMSDAFWLGAFAAKLGLPANAPLHKSRGYFWFLNDVKYLVEGKRIRRA